MRRWIIHLESDGNLPARSLRFASILTAQVIAGQMWNFWGVDDGPVSARLSTIELSHWFEREFTHFHRKKHFWGGRQVIRFQWSEWSTVGRFYCKCNQTITGSFEAPEHTQAPDSRLAEKALRRFTMVITQIGSDENPELCEIQKRSSER